MQKKNVFVLVVVVILLTVVTTFALTKEFSEPKVMVVEKTNEDQDTTSNENNGDASDDENSDDLKISEGHILTDDEYNNYVDLKTKYSDIDALVEFTEENFLYDCTEEQMLLGAKKGVLESLDEKYTMFYSKEEFDDLLEDTMGSFVGIGVYISPSDDNKILVIAPIEDTPADKAGIKTGDKIVKIDGVDYTGDQIDDAVSHMRGVEGTEVVITVEREVKDSSETELFDLTVNRDVIKIKTIKGQMMEDDMGYIRITTFTSETAADFKKMYNSLKDEGMTSLVLDLRSNPGGLVTQSTDICDMFIDEGFITYTKTKSGEKQFYYADNKKEDIPMVILVDGGSASASEIMTGAFKDLGIAKIVGTKTFGKGIVQTFMAYGDDGEGLKMTVAQYFTPNDVCIHGIGIEPDVEVELNEGIDGVGPDYADQDNQLQKGIEVLNQLIKDKAEE